MKRPSIWVPLSNLAKTWRALTGRVLGRMAPLASLGLAVGVWALVARLEIVNPLLFPGPDKVARAALDLWREGFIISDLSASLRRAAVGFVVGATLGTVTALLTAKVSVFGFLLTPVLSVLRPIPAIALVPIAIVWFGVGEPPKYFVVGSAVFFVTWLSSHHGIGRISPTYLRAAESLGASRRRIFFEVVLPAAAPFIVGGLRIGAGLAFLTLVAAELTGAASGIGFRLEQARQFIRTDWIFVSLLELGILGAALDGFFSVVARRLIHWH